MQTYANSKRSVIAISFRSFESDLIISLGGKTGTFDHFVPVNCDY
jgi:hypothetical protein